METAFYAFGTSNYIRIDTPLPERIQRSILDDCRKLSEEFDRLFSAFRDDSEISQIRAEAGNTPVHVSSLTFRLLQRAQYFSKASFGAFDITIRPALELWRIGQSGERIPSDRELHSVKRLVNYKDLVLEPETHTAFLRKKGEAIDLGGIAKGYAADRIAEELRSRCVENALLNFGGTIVTIGCKADGSDWCAGIQNPLQSRGKIVGYVTLDDGALVTSAVNERYFQKDGVRYAHLLDPRTCMPARSGVLGVTAAGGTAADLDGLTTALFVLGPEKGIPLATRLGMEALYLMEDGNIIATDGFAVGKYQFKRRLHHE